MKVPAFLVLVILLAGCGGAGGTGAGTTTPPTTTTAPPTTTIGPPTTTAPTTTAILDEHLLAEFEYGENGLCALTDERTRTGQPAGYLALCIMREEEGVPFITCSAFPSASSRAGKELEFHGFPGAQKLPDPKNWATPGCETAARKAAAWLVRHLAAS